MLFKNKNKAKRSKGGVGFAKNPLDFKHLGEVSPSGHLVFTLNEEFKYLGDASEMKKSIPNVDKLVRMLGGLIVVDLETKEYMVVKVKDAQRGLHAQFKALNSMTELINFKKFINQNVAISVNMDALRTTASEQASEEETVQDNDK